MKRSCNRALYETAGAIDYDVLWLDDCVEQLVVPRTLSDGTALVSVFTLSKILYDFIDQSGLQRVSSRDAGRYLKFLRLGNVSVLEDLKRSYGGLKPFLLTSEVFCVMNRDNDSVKEDSSDNAYWIGLQENAKERLLEEAQRTSFTTEEKAFFDRYSLQPLQDKRSAYWHSQLVQQAKELGVSPRQYWAKMKTSDRTSNTSPVRDYSACKVAELKDACRERGLQVTGTKAQLLQRLLANDETTTVADTATNSRPAGWVSLVPDETADYLTGLLEEYLRASGGKAGSRDIGRYLAANKSSDGHAEVSALQEVKQYYGSLASFSKWFPEKFHIVSQPQGFSVLLMLP